MKHPVNILLIEDNETDQIMAREAFASTGLKSGLRTARTGSIAKELILQAKPDLIVLDLNLPGENGLELLRELKSRVDTKNIPVIVCSGSNSAADVSASYSAGAGAYVCKPLVLEKYFELFSSLDRFWNFVEFNGERK